MQKLEVQTKDGALEDMPTVQCYQPREPEERAGEGRGKRNSRDKGGWAPYRTPGDGCPETLRRGVMTHRLLKGNKTCVQQPQQEPAVCAHLLPRWSSYIEH